MKLSVYLAGPGVFHSDADDLRRELLRLCNLGGLQGLWPGDNDHADPDWIFRANVALIRQCHGVIADITPFRGIHMDPGTAWEIGFAYALDKPIVAYTTVTGPLFARAAEPVGGRDHNGDLVEDFGLPENLMIAISAARRIVVNVDRMAAVDMALAELVPLIGGG